MVPPPWASGPSASELSVQELWAAIRDLQSQVEERDEEIEALRRQQDALEQLVGTALVEAGGLRDRIHQAEEGRRKGEADAQRTFNRLLAVEKACRQLDAECDHNRHRTAAVEGRLDHAEREITCWQEWHTTWRRTLRYLAEAAYINVDRQPHTWLQV